MDDKDFDGDVAPRDYSRTVAAGTIAVQSRKCAKEHAMCRCDARYREQRDARADRFVHRLSKAVVLGAVQSESASAVYSYSQAMD